MKSNFYLLALLTAIFLCYSNLAAQTQTITKEEFNLTKDKAESNSFEKARIETENETGYSGGKVTSTSTYTKEFLPPKQSKSLLVVEKGNSVEKTEEIVIGDTLYKKHNNENWVKTKLDNFGGGSYTGITVAKSESISKYRLETVKDGNEIFQVLKDSTVDHVGQLNAYYEREYWIKNGLLYKKVSVTSINNQNNVLYKSVENYDYNPKNLKIEAPIK